MDIIEILLAGSTIYDLLYRRYLQEEEASIVIEKMI